MNRFSFIATLLSPLLGLFKKKRVVLVGSPFEEMLMKQRSLGSTSPHRMDGIHGQWKREMHIEDDVIWECWYKEPSR